MIRHQPWATPPHDFSIGLKPIAQADWFEGGDPEAARKCAMLEAGEDVWAECAGSESGQTEALTLVEQATGQTADPALPPLMAASLLVADDLCLMQRGEGGWTLTAISLCSGSYFTAGEAIGKPLFGLHEPVPGFEARFLPRVERIFDALAPDTLLKRRNWTVTASGEAHLPSSAPVRALLPTIAPDEVGERLFVRVERQTLRKLPKTGAVLFTIRPWRWPLSALAADPEALSAFAAAWRGADPAFRAYKGLAPYDALVGGFLASR